MEHTISWGYDERFRIIDVVEVNDDERMIVLEVKGRWPLSKWKRVSLRKLDPVTYLWLGSGIPLELAPEFVWVALRNAKAETR